MKTLSLVIPVYNEEKRIRKTLEALKQGFSFSPLKLEKVIFVDDGSVDRTKTEIRKQKTEVEKKLKAKIEIISYKANRGKGYAVKTGMLASDSDYTLFMDADMATPLWEFKKFIAYIKKDVPVIIGTRKNGGSTVIRPQPLYRQLLGRGFTLLANLILNIWVTDFTCGFKAFSRQAKDKIFSESVIKRWGYDAEILFLANKLDFPIVEKAVLWSDDKQTRVKLWLDLPRSFIELLQIRLAHSEFLPAPIRKLALVNSQV